MLNLIFLHGTLQRQASWNETFAFLKSSNHNLNFLVPDFYLDNPDNLDLCYHKIISQIPKNTKSVFIGYSLGGRFAIELYKRTEKKDVAGLVLISMDPGIENPVENQETLKRDQLWANKFLDSDWNLLIEEWNSLPVFSGIKPHKLQEEGSFNREDLAKLWMLTSKANNPNLWPELPNILCPVLLVSGVLDSKFHGISTKMKELISNVEFCEFKECGHRVPWEDTEKFNENLLKFLIDL